VKNRNPEIITTFAKNTGKQAGILEQMKIAVWNV
jgi:hypothetical protein